MSKKRVYRSGDFVWFTYAKQDKYPARIIELNNEKVRVELFFNEEFLSDSDKAIEVGNVSQLTPMF